MGPPPTPEQVAHAQHIGVTLADDSRAVPHRDAHEAAAWLLDLEDCYRRRRRAPRSPAQTATLLASRITVFGPDSQNDGRSFGSHACPYWTAK